MPRKQSQDDTFDTSPEAMADVLGGNAQSQLHAFVERIEQIEKEEAEIRETKKEVYAELKGAGFDVKVTKKVVKIRKIDRAKRQEEDAILDTYLHATGDAL